MLRRGQLLRLTSRLPIHVAEGLTRDYDPQWPLPLPPQMPHPSSPNRPTLVLDIDETLIHTLGESEHPDSKHLAQYHVLLRPHLSVFMKEVMSLFEVVLWTAGVATYAAAIANLLERTLGLPESPLYSAKCLRDVVESAAPDASSPRRDGLLSRPPASSPAGAEREAVPLSDTVHWYVLSRSQTLERRSWMKYIPLLGRDTKRVVMIDDNVRSFPLTPRHGIKIDPFQPSTSKMNAYWYSLQELRLKTPQFPHVVHANSRESQLSRDYLSSVAGGNDSHVSRLEAGLRELHRLEDDRALLDVLPMLRSVAEACAKPQGDDASRAADATHELDYWRPDGYEMCDDFASNINPDSTQRTGMLGRWLPSRRADGPVRSFKMAGYPHNYPLVEEATTQMKDVWRRSANASYGSVMGSGRSKL